MACSPAKTRSTGSAQIGITIAVRTVGSTSTVGSSVDGASVVMAK